jgi:hypothetical protein
MDPNPSLKTVLRSRPRAERAPTLHPASEELAAYVTGELGGVHRQRLVDHLAHCRECAGWVRDLAGLEEITVPAAVEARLDHDTEGAWELLQKRIAGDEKVGGGGG